MRLTAAIIALGIALITTQCMLSVSSQDSSSEEDTLENRLKKQYKPCSEGYCVPKHQCLDGVLNTDGVDILEVRIDLDYEDFLNQEQQQHKCEFLTTCCATKDGLRSGLAEPGKDFTPPALLPPSRCGTNHPDGYIYRVNNASGIAQFGEFPWMAALLTRTTVLDQERFQNFCGGSLIHPKVVLTAAHCVQPYTSDLGTLRVRLGEWDTVAEREPIIHQEYGVQKIVIHEGYVPKKYHNDLALLIMETAAELTVNVNTICLPSEGDSFDDQRCLVSGWGQENFNAEGKYAEVLKKVELPVVPRNRCKSMLWATKLGQVFKLHPSFMCAGGELGVDACKGDGGSPLSCKAGDHYVQAGIVAWGIGCGQKDVPAAYVQVANFVGWIKQTLQREGISDL